MGDSRPSLRLAYRTVRATDAIAQLATSLKSSQLQCRDTNGITQGARTGLKGKPVQSRRGPATVIRKMIFHEPLDFSGKAEDQELRTSALPVSQETCHGIRCRFLRRTETMRSAFGSLEVFISPPLAVAAKSVPHPLACRSVARRNLEIGIGILSFEVPR